jgi:hypothetical protein
MTFTRGSAQLSTIDFVLRNTEEIENTFYNVEYQDFYWSDMIPQASVQTNINPGATISSYPVMDHTGQGEFRSQFGGDMPTVGISTSKVPVPIEVAGITSIVDREDVRQWTYANGGSINTEYARIMREACDRHVENVFFYGSTALSSDWAGGFMDLQNVTVVTAPLNGGATSSEWVDKTPEEKIADVNILLNGITEDSLETRVADTLRLPTSQYNLLVSTQLPNVNMNLLEFIKKNNAYTARTGRELTITPLPHLDGAGVAGVDRIMAYENTERNFKMPFPIPYELLAPQEHGYAVKQLAEYKFGPVHARYPVAIRYMDGV